MTRTPADRQRAAAPFQHTAPWLFRLPGRIWIPLILAVLLSSCVAAQAPEKASQAEQADLFWPSPPLPTQIRWVGEVRNYHDAGLTDSLWKRLSGLLFGKEQNAIVRPYGVHIDQAGRLYVADPGAGVVHLMDRQQNRYTLIPQGAEGSLLSPIGITSDDAGRAYFTDSAAASVLRYDPRRRDIERLDLHGLQRPTGIAFNRQNGLLYIADTTAHQILVCDQNGIERRRFGRRGTRSGELNFPTDLWVDSAGQIVVTDSLNSRLQIFSAEGAPIGTLGRRGDEPGYFNKPKGVATDSDGHLYVCDTLLDTVQVFDTEGRLILHFGTRGTESGQFWMPSGLFIDRQDFIYVADTYNRRIQIFKYVGGAP